MTQIPDKVPAAERTRLRRLVWERRLIVAATLVVFLAMWELVGRLTNPMFFAPPSAIFSAFWEALTDPQAKLLLAVLQTLSILVPGFLLACVLGIGLGVLMGRSNLAYHILDPYVTIFYNIPRVALIPILLLWLG